MNRRDFVKRGALFVPTIFIPRLIRAQDLATAEGLAAFGTNAPAGGGGGGGDTVFITSFTGNAASGFNGKVGTRFKPASNITITSLGRYVVSGNSATHVVRLWDAGTTGTQCTIEVASVTISTSGQTANSVVYGSITPATLDSTHYYSIYSDESSGGDQYFSDNSTSTTTTSDGTINASTYYDTSCHVSNNGVRTYGVNFRYHL